MFLSSLYLLPSSEAESPKALASLVPRWEQWGSWQKQPTIFLQLSQRFVHTAAEVTEAKVRWDTTQASSPLPTLQTGTALPVPNGARATSALFQGSHSYFASSYVLENERGRNLQHVKGNREGGCQVSQALSQCTEHSSKAPLHTTLDWEDLRKKSQTNFKSRITDFRFYNKSVGAHFFLHKPLFIFFYKNTIL